MNWDKLVGYEAGVNSNISSPTGKVLGIRIKNNIGYIEGMGFKYIHTEYEVKPLKSRDYDWSAIYEDHIPLDIIGFGKTEDEAIEDLENQNNCKIHVSLGDEPHSLEQIEDEIGDVLKQIKDTEGK